jgi:hypothetical protein
MCEPKVRPLLHSIPMGRRFFNLHKSAFLLMAWTVCASPVVARAQALPTSPQDGTQLTEDAIMNGPPGSGRASGGQTAPSKPSPATPNQIAPPAFQKENYERANENLAVQVEYLQNRITSLEDLREGNEIIKDDKSVDTDRLDRETEGFCANGSSAGTDTVQEKNATQCLNDYIELKRGQLVQLKPSLTQNQDSIAHLQNKTIGADGKPLAGESGKAVGIEPALPQGKTLKDTSPPFVPKFVDLTPAYEKAVLTQNPKASEAQTTAWVTAATEEPQRQNFYETTDVRIDPSRPSEGSTKVLKLDEKGQPKVDEAAYKQAVAAWRTGDETSIYGQRGRAVAPNSFKARVTERTKLAEKTAPAKRAALKRAVNPLATAVGAIDKNGAMNKYSKDDDVRIRRDFIGARNIIVMNFNGEFQPKPNQNRNVQDARTPGVHGATGTSRADVAVKQKLSASKFREEMAGFKEEDLKPQPTTGISAGKGIHSLYLNPDSINQFVRDDLTEQGRKIGPTAGTTPTPADPAGGSTVGPAPAPPPATVQPPPSTSVTTTDNPQK